MKDFVKSSLKKSFPAFLAISLSICVFFLIFRFNSFNSGLGKIVGILRPFVIGLVLAYLLKTPYNYIEGKMIKVLTEKRLGLARILSVIIVLALTFLIIIVLLMLVIPALANSLISIANGMPAFIDNITNYLKNTDFGDKELTDTIVSALETAENSAIPWLQNNLFSNLNETINGVLSTVTGILKILYNVLIGIIICIYVLLSKKTFARQGKMLIYATFSKKNADWIMDELSFIDGVFNGFFAGKILDSTIVGLICFVFCLILHFTMGLNNVVLISVIIGVTNIIPFFGPYIGGIPCALLALMDGPAVCIVFAIFIVLLQQFDGNYLGPRCLSKGVGLSGFWVLFSITLFGGLMGIVGIIIGVPVFAVIYDLIRRLVHLGLKKNNVKVEEIE